MWYFGKYVYTLNCKSFYIVGGGGYLWQEEDQQKVIVFNEW